MRRLIRVVVGAFAIVASRSSHAQVCLGYAAFSSGPVRASVAYQDDPGTDVYRGEVGYGRASSDFGVLGVQHTASRNTPAGYSGSSNRLDGLAGHAFSVAGADWAQVCPLVRVGYTRASSGFPTGTVDDNDISYGFGGAFGMNMSDSPSSRVVPSFAVEYVGNRIGGTTTTTFGSASLPSRTMSSGLWTLSVGLGTGGFTVTPYINHTFGVPSTVSVWGVRASVNVGSPRR